MYTAEGKNKQAVFAMQQSAKSIWLESAAQKYLRKEVGSEVKTFQMIVLLLWQVHSLTLYHLATGYWVSTDSHAFIPHLPKAFAHLNISRSISLMRHFVLRNFTALQGWALRNKNIL